MLEIKNISKTFGEQKVLKDVSLKVNTGEVVALIGQSGTGKTTLLRCINFLERADAGSLLIGDKEISFKKAHKKDILTVRRKTAFVFQNYGLFTNKTAIENVAEGLIVARKVPRKEAVERAKEALDWVGLSAKYDSYPSQLSGGQQQRIGIARAVVLHPEVILFDEPTSALDPELVNETLQVIKKVADTGITMIIVTHELSFARNVADKVVFLDKGEIVEAGSPEEIFVNPKEDRTRKFLGKFIPPEYNI